MKNGTKRLKIKPFSGISEKWGLFLFGLFFVRIGDRARGNDLIDKAEFLRFFRRHEIVPLHRFFDHGQFLVAMTDIDFVQKRPQTQDFLGLNLDIGRLALRAAARLVDHDAGVRQRETLAGLAGRQQQRAHRRRLPDADGRHVRLDILHGVVHREPRGHDAARRVDIKGNILLRILGFEEQELRAGDRRNMVVNLAGQKNDPLLQQARIDVVSPLAPVGHLDDGGDQETVRLVKNVGHGRDVFLWKRTLVVRLKVARDGGLFKPDLRGERFVKREFMERLDAAISLIYHDDFKLQLVGCSRENQPFHNQSGSYFFQRSQ
jgi:hypothetical protein